MALVGNDVVDLTDSETASQHESARFVARVCNEAERRELLEASDPKRLFWSFFSAKEAAYKLVQKLEPRVPFAHRAFEVAGDLASVRHGDRTLLLEMEQAEGYVHAVASTREERALSGTFVLGHGTDESRAVRRQLCAAMAFELGCEAGELEVVRATARGSWDGFGPPVVFWRGEPLAGDVSLSHHGRFGAFAAVLTQRSDQGGPSPAIT